MTWLSGHCLWEPLRTSAPPPQPLPLHPHPSPPPSHPPPLPCACVGVVLALQIPLIVVVTKVDLASDHILGQTKTQLFKVLKSGAANKLPVQMRSARDVELVVGAEGDKVCPVFFVSCVTGVHIGLLHDYIGRLKAKRTDWLKVAGGLGEGAAGTEAKQTGEGRGRRGG